MTFSYLGSIKKLTDEVIYQRGLRSYLDGNVLDYKNLPLDNWRLYEVLDGRDIYKIRFPIAHLLISDITNLGSSLETFTECECEYYEEYGLCKHIIAIAAKIDREFIKKQKENQPQKNNESTLDNFLQIENQKKENQWLNNIEYYIDIADTLDTADLMSQMLRDMVSEIFQNTNKYTSFLQKLDNIIRNSIVDYTKEKRIVNIIANNRFLLIGSKPWWDFWKVYISDFDANNQSNLYYKLWTSYKDYPSAFWDFEVEFIDFIKESDNELKKSILDKLDLEIKDKKVLAEFCLKTEYTPWISNNLDILDPFYLIQVSHTIPDKADEIEIRLTNQIKLWSDFLQTGNYDEIARAFRLWREKLGSSSLYEETLKYVKTNHKKKKKLLRLLED